MAQTFALCRHLLLLLVTLGCKQNPAHTAVKAPESQMLRHVTCTLYWREETTMLDLLTHHSESSKVVTSSCPSHSASHVTRYASAHTISPELLQQHWTVVLACCASSCELQPSLLGLRHVRLGQTPTRCACWFWQTQTYCACSHQDAHTLHTVIVIKLVDLGLTLHMHACHTMMSVHLPRGHRSRAQPELQAQQTRLAVQFACNVHLPCWCS